MVIIVSKSDQMESVGANKEKPIYLKIRVVLAVRK